MYTTTKELRCCSSGTAGNVWSDLGFQEEVTWGCVRMSDLRKQAALSEPLMTSIWCSYGEPQSREQGLGVSLDADEKPSRGDLYLASGCLRTQQWSPPILSLFVNKGLSANQISTQSYNFRWYTGNLRLKLNLNTSHLFRQSHILQHSKKVDMKAIRVSLFVKQQVFDWVKNQLDQYLLSS